METKTQTPRYSVQRAWRGSRGALAAARRRRPLRDKGGKEGVWGIDIEQTNGGRRPAPNPLRTGQSTRRGCESAIHLLIKWEVRLKVLDTVVLWFTARPPCKDSRASSGEVFTPAVIHVLTLRSSKQW